MNDSFTIFAGRANVALATSVAVQMGARLGACSVERFPDGELSVRLDEPVRGRKVFIIQPTSPPVNDHLIELLASPTHAAAHRPRTSRRSSLTSVTREPTNGTAAAS